jgi:hypothetical protein
MDDLAPALSGLGCEENPAPVVRPEEVVSTLTDGEGRTTTYNIGPLGRFSGITDPAGFTSIIERDEDGNPTQSTINKQSRRIIWQNIYLARVPRACRFENFI